MEELTPADMVMAEIAANIEALVAHAVEGVAHPPRGTIREVGHLKTLNERLKRKDLEALDHLLNELAYNVAATIFATLDGSVESDFPTFPRLALVDQATGQPLAPNLHAAFAAMWEEETGERENGGT